MSENIYLDNAATTRMYKEVKEAMEPYLEDEYGNASTEACQAILHYAAEELEMKRIYVRTSNGNLPSQKLAEKLGLLKVESITEYKDLLYCGLLTFEG